MVLLDLMPKHKVLQNQTLEIMKKVTNKLPLIVAVLFISTFKLTAEESDTSGIKKNHRHNEIEDKKLEVELELYPFNLFNFHEEIIKDEVMFDYHDFLGEKKRQMVGVRYFNDVNVHVGKREMTDLIWYTEMYAGFKHWLQLGWEIGSVNSRRYIL